MSVSFFYLGQCITPNQNPNTSSYATPKQTNWVTTSKETKNSVSEDCGFGRACILVMDYATYMFPHCPTLSHCVQTNGKMKRTEKREFPSISRFVTVNHMLLGNICERKGSINCIVISMMVFRGSIISWRAVSMISLRGRTQGGQLCSDLRINRVQYMD